MTPCNIYIHVYLNKLNFNVFNIVKFGINVLVTIVLVHLFVEHVSVHPHRQVVMEQG